MLGVQSAAAVPMLSMFIFCILLLSCGWCCSILCS